MAFFKSYVAVNNKTPALYWYTENKISVTFNENSNKDILGSIYEDEFIIRGADGANNRSYVIAGSG